MSVSRLFLLVFVFVCVCGRERFTRLAKVGSNVSD